MSHCHYIAHKINKPLNDGEFGETLFVLKSQKHERFWEKKNLLLFKKNLTLVSKEQYMVFSGTILLVEYVFDLITSDEKFL